MNKAIFLDKDGTLIDDLPYNVNPQLLTWKEGVYEALKMLANKGFLLVIITNQAGVARGLFEEKDLLKLIETMRDTLKEHGIPLAGFYYCPHHTEGKIKVYTLDCDCRKPKPGMIIRAAAELEIDLKESWMIGDMQKDVEAGDRAGCRTVLIDGTEQANTGNNRTHTPDFVAESIKEAAHHIIST